MQIANLHKQRRELHPRDQVLKVDAQSIAKLDYTTK